MSVFNCKKKKKKKEKKREETSKVSCTLANVMDNARRPWPFPRSFSSRIEANANTMN